ncbi:MAG: hypothetical protein WCF93_04300 [Candidatus Moraniibacteriota bacterium]
MEPIDEKDLDFAARFNRPVSDNFQEKEIPVQTTEREMPTEISSAERDSAYGRILSKVQAQTDDTDQDDVSDDAKTAAKKTNAQSQVSYLIDIAGQKGVVHAVKVARQMEDNYVLDNFHDKLLADELHNALIARGMIKEI